MNRALIIQTAFLGDLILTLPLLQRLKQEFEDAKIDMLVIPSTKELLADNSLINEVIVYDKRRTGIRGLLKLSRFLKGKKYDVILSPHRSSRSAIIAKLSAAKQSVSFDSSALSFLYNNLVKYERGKHEIQRNLSLLKPLEINESSIIPPELFISERQKVKVDEILNKGSIIERKFAAIAPGAVWMTKRYPEEKYSRLARILSDNGVEIVLIGGKNDAEISRKIVRELSGLKVTDLTGTLSVLESAEVIRKAGVLICNDSAPLHMGNAVGTPVFAVFGSTVPAFGFYPYNNSDEVFETTGLDCRPCGIHGRKSCPLKTLDCLELIDERSIAIEVLHLLGKAVPKPG